MGNSEKLWVKWKDYQKDVTSQFRKFRETEDFTDVTLVCKDGQKFSAHKIILASSSPFFWDLLKSYHHSHPLIYMRGFRSQDMVAMLDFLYHGEANVFQENVNSFLEFAEELQLSGLNQTKEELMSKSDPAKKGRPKKYVKRARSFPKYENSYTDIDSKFIEELEKTIAITKESAGIELEELDSQINSMMEFSQVKVEGQGRMRICKVCGKEGQRSNVMDHIEAHHITGFSHDCGVCGKTSRYQHPILRHKILPFFFLKFTCKYILGRETRTGFTRR